MSDNDAIAIKRILKALHEKGAANAGDIVNATGLPRYYVLAAFQILHELGYINLIYSKGSHKVYEISERGREFLEEKIEGSHEEEKAET
ncbi:MAG: hypothetical protein QXR92_05655 [Fervidicoccaceae archaeon]